MSCSLACAPGLVACHDLHDTCLHTVELYVAATAAVSQFQFDSSKQTHLLTPSDTAASTFDLTHFHGAFGPGLAGDEAS